MRRLPHQLFLILVLASGLFLRFILVMLWRTGELCMRVLGCLFLLFIAAIVVVTHTLFELYGSARVVLRALGGKS